MNFDSIAAFIANPTVAVVVAFVLEVVMRIVKTDKPVSIMILVSGVLKGIVKILMAVDGLLDKVIPQNAPPAPPAV